MNYNWIILSAFAAIATAIGTIALKVIDNNILDNNFILAVVFILMGIYSFIYLLINNKFTYKNLNNCSKITLIILVVYAFFIISEYSLMVNALKYSPNISFTRIIMNLNIIVTLLVSYFLFKEKINFKTFVGILLSFIGLSIIVYYSNE